MLDKRYSNNTKSIIPLRKKQRNAKNKIIDDIAYNEDFLISRDCVCSANIFDVLSEKDAYGLPCSVVICKQCGLIQVSPCPNKQALDSFYKEYYNDLYGENTDYDALFTDMSCRGDNIVEFISKYGTRISSTKGNVLEVGCSVGGILDAFNRAGYNVQGTDLNPDAVQYANTRNLQVKYGSIADINASNRFDIIILSHVMEHFLNIKREMSVIENLLRDEGLLYIEVPGIYSSLGSVQFDFLDFIEFDHLYYFSLDTLVNVMHINGFILISGDEETGDSIRAVFKKNTAGTGDIAILKSCYNDSMKRLEYLEECFQKQKLRHYAYRLLKAMPISLKLKIKSIIRTR